MSPLDHQAIPDAQGAQEFQSFTMSATADVIAAILSKLADQEVKIDDLVIFSGRQKVWDGTDEDFPRDDTFNDVAGRLQEALMDPESKASFRVYLQYPDGERVEIFRQTAGKIVKDDYNLANDLRAAYALDAVDQFTPERGEQDFVIGYDEAQAMAKAQGFQIPEQPSAGGDSQQSEPVTEPEPNPDRTETQTELLPDVWADPVTEPIVQSSQQTELSDRASAETQIEQLPDAIANPIEEASPQSESKSVDVPDLTYSQQRNLAALEDVNGQLVELDRRAAKSGMTYLTDPAQNPGYKSLMDRAELLREGLGDLAILANVPSLNSNSVIDVVATPMTEAEVSASSIQSEDLGIPKSQVNQLEQENDDLLASIPDSVFQTTSDEQVEQENDEFLAEIDRQVEEYHNDASNFDYLGDPEASEESTLYPETEAEYEETNTIDDVQSTQQLETNTESSAIAVAGVSAMTEPPIYEQAFIEDIFDDYPLEVKVQNLLVGVADVRGQLETLRNDMNFQLQSTAQLSDSIVQNVESPPIERWADKIGGVAETQATGWKEQLRNAVAVTVEFAQQIYESPVGQYVVEQTIAGLDAAGQYIGDKAERDIQTTKAFVADRLAGTMPESERLDAGIALLIEHKGSTEDDRGIAHHEGYTFLKSGAEHGVIRDSDGAAIYKSGNFTGQTSSEDKEYLTKFSSVAAAAAPLIEAAHQQQSAPSRSSGGASAGA
jgi:hypothetical protein